MKIVWSIIETIAGVVFRFCFRMVGREYTDATHETLMQFVKFGIVGLSNTFISYCLYSFTLIALRKIGVVYRYDYLIAIVIAFSLSVLWSFYWNNKKVFVQKEVQERNTWKALIKTFISYSFTGLFLSGVLMVLWVQVLGISEFMAPIINLLITVPLNFIINKYWAFKS